VNNEPFSIVEEAAKANLRPRRVINGCPEEPSWKFDLKKDRSVKATSSFNSYAAFLAHLLYSSLIRYPVKNVFRNLLAAITTHMSGKEVRLSGSPKYT
jgi:hypothetical protein